MSAPFAPGTAVRVAMHPVSGHCRTPAYLRGRTGHVVACMGTFRDPERLAYHRPGLPMRALYRVRFPQAALWPDYAGDPRDMLEADIYEHWLEAFEEERP